MRILRSLRRKQPIAKQIILASSLFQQNLLRTGLPICIAVMIVTGMAWAQAGQLDTTFAARGILLLNSIGEQGGSTRVALQTRAIPPFVGI